MPNVKAIDCNSLASAVTVTTTSETAFLTSNKVPTTLPTNRVLVDFTCELTTGTGGLTATLKIYRGTAVAGSPIYTSDAFTVAAGNKYSLEAAFADTLANTEGAVYTCSITIGSASGNSTVDNATATVIVF